MKATLLARSAAAIAALSIFAACGGGGGTSPTPSTPSSTATPTPSPNPNSQSVSVPVGSSAANQQLPTVNGFSGSLQLPGATAASGTTISVTATTTAPGNLPALQVRRRNAGSSTAPTAYFFESITPSANVTFDSIPGFTLTLPETIPTAGQDFYIAIFAPGQTSWQMQADGPAVVSGQTLTFPGIPGQTVTLNAGQTYWFAFYSIPSSAPPTSAPPTTAPAAVIDLSPASLSFLDTNANDKQTVTASEDGYTGSFNAPASCVASDGTTMVASIAPGSTANTFVVSPVAAGTCSATVTDSNNNSTTLNVSVTTTTVGGQ